MFGAIATATALTMGAPAAHAQERPLVITLTGDVEHHNNAARASAAQAALRGLERSDTIFRPAVDVTLQKTAGFATFDLNANLGYDFYARNTQLNRERLSLAGTISASLSRCRFDLTPYYARHQTDLGDIAVIGDLGENSVVNVETIKSIHLSGRCGGPVGFAPVASIGYETGDNSNDLREISDYRAVDYGAGISYAQPAFGELTIKGDLRDLTYPNRPGADGRDDGFKQTSVNATFTRDLGANLRGTVSAGYTWLDPRSPGVPSFDGLTWSADLTATFADRLQIKALMSRSASPTLQTNAAYAVNRDIALTADFAVTDRLSLTAGYANGKRRYEGVVAPVPALQRATTDNYSASLDYKLNDKLRFGIFGRYLKRSSDQVLFNYDDTVVGANVSFRF